MKFFYLCILCLFLFSNLSLAKYYKISIDGNITGTGWSNQDIYYYVPETVSRVNDYFVVGDEFRIDIILNGDAVVTNIDFMNFATISSGIFELRYNVINNPQSTPGLYAFSNFNRDFELRKSGVIEGWNLGGSLIEGVGSTELKLVGLGFTSLLETEFAVGDTLESIIEGKDVSFSNNGEYGIMIDDDGQYMAEVGLELTQIDINAYPANEDSIILNTYKSNDMQNWELIESKEIQSEDALFLKSEIVTQ